MDRITSAPAILCMLALLSLLALSPHTCHAQADGDRLYFATYRMVPSRVLGEERRIVVRLPQGYAETGRSYPVIYKLHGSSIDFLGRIAGRFSLLAETGRIPEAILVGIEQHGHSEMLPRGHGGPPVDIHAEEFMDFVVTELIPFVDRNYRTQDLRILLGTYDCGLFAIYTMLTMPDAFGAYLTSSPSFSRGGEIVLERARTVLAEGSSLNTTLHVTHRRNAQGEVAPRIAEFLALLESEASDVLIWSADCLPREDHDRWAPYVSHGRALLTYFDGFECPAEVLSMGLDATRAHYEGLSRRLGVAISIPERVLYDLGNELGRLNRREEAIEVLEILKQENPGSLNAAFGLARFYKAVGDFDRAIQNYNAALQNDRCPPFLRGELEAIEKSAAYAIERAIAAGGCGAGMQVCRAVEAGERADLVIVEREFNEVGYRLLGQGRTSDAIAVFELNVALHPESANTYDSLGEAYMTAEQTALAIENYRRSLELNPGNSNAAQMLRQLEDQPR